MISWAQQRQENGYYFCGFPTLGATCKLVGRVVRSQIHLRRFRLKSEFQMDGLGQQQAVLGLPDPGRQRRGSPSQSKMSGARY